MKRLIWVLVPIVCSAIAYAGTCGNGYAYSQQYRLNHSVIPNSDQTNFPVTMCFNGANCATTSPLTALKTVANGGQIQNTSGSPVIPDDLQLCTAASAGDPLKYEVDPGSYDAATGKLILYVQFPTASHTTDVDFWIFANNSSVTTSQEDLTLWTDANYAAVYHFPSSGSFSANDSTTNANNGSVQGTVTATTGVVGGGGSGWSTSNYVQVPFSSSYHPTGAITMEGCFTASSIPSGWLVSIPFSTSGWSVPFTNGLATDPSGVYVLRLADSGGGQHLLISGGTTPANTYSCIAGTYDGSTMRLYKNGVADANTTSASFTIGYNASARMAVGMRSQYSTGEPMTGATEDEVRISTVARSADWMAAQGANFSDPRSFIYQVKTCSGCGTVTVVQSTTGTCSGGSGALTSCTVSPAWTVTAGNTLIYSVCVIKNVASVPTISSVTDTLSNTFTAELTTGFNKSASDSQTCALYRAQNITGGTDTSFTATISSGGSNSIWTVIALEVSGLQNVARDAAGGNAGPYPVSSGYVPTTNAGDWVVSYGWILADAAFPLNVGSSSVPSCLNAVGTLHTVSATNGSDSATMGMSYCSVSATAPNHSEWNRAFVSTPDNHNGIAAFIMTPGSATRHIPSQQY
jgi:hypothetical protein